MGLNVKEELYPQKSRMVKLQPFSVVMSVYRNDHYQFLDCALKSIIENQTIMPDEVVLVVDGPVTDELNSVIEHYCNKYSFFQLIRLRCNCGLGNALKVAVDHAKYELIARMDSDDVSLPNRFELQLRFFEEYPDVDIVGGNIAEFIDEESNIVGVRIVPKSNDEIREYMKRRCAMNHVSVMFKRKAIVDAGGYIDWFWNEDYFLWVRMWLNGSKFANIDAILVNVRVSKDMYMRRGGKAYYQSEKKLQKYMLDHEMIEFPTYVLNVAKRFVVEICMTNRLRSWTFRNFARKKYLNYNNKLDTLR